MDQNETRFKVLWRTHSFEKGARKLNQNFPIALAVSPPQIQNTNSPWGVVFAPRASPLDRTFVPNAPLKSVRQSGIQGISLGLLFWFVFWQVPKNEQTDHSKLSLSVDEPPNAHRRCSTLFSLQARGANKKALQKRNAVFCKGYAPLTAVAF